MSLVVLRKGEPEVNSFQGQGKQIRIGLKSVKLQDYDVDPEAGASQPGQPRSTHPCPLCSLFGLGSLAGRMMDDGAAP